MPVKHQFVSNKHDGADPTKVKPSDWNADHEVIINLATGEVIGTLPLERGGTGGHDQQSALNNLLPYQGYYPGYILATDGSNASWSWP